MFFICNYDFFKDENICSKYCSDIFSLLAIFFKGSGQLFLFNDN